MTKREFVKDLIEWKEEVLHEINDDLFDEEYWDDISECHLLKRKFLFEFYINFDSEIRNIKEIIDHIAEANIPDDYWLRNFWTHQMLDIMEDKYKESKSWEDLLDKSFAEYSRNLIINKFEEILTIHFIDLTLFIIEYNDIKKINIEINDYVKLIEKKVSEFRSGDFLNKKLPIKISELEKYLIK